jgi:hypothetical protein
LSFSSGHKIGLAGLAPHWPGPSYWLSYAVQTKK